MADLRGHDLRVWSLTENWCYQAKTKQKKPTPVNRVFHGAKQIILASVLYSEYSKTCNTSTSLYGICTSIICSSNEKLFR